MWDMNSDKDEWKGTVVAFLWFGMVTWIPLLIAVWMDRHGF